MFAKDRDKWQAFVNKLCGLRVSQQAGISVLAEGLLSSSRKEVFLESVTYTASIHPHRLFSMFKLDL